MNQYLFILGHTPSLSLLELQSLLKKNDFTEWNKHLVATSLESDEQVQQLQQILGGTYKVLKIVKELKNLNKIDLEVAQYIANPEEKVFFGLTKINFNYSINEADIKKSLKNIGCKSRYQDTDEWGLSTAILSDKDNIRDLFLINHDNKNYLVETISFQNLEDWVKRDRQKPYVSGKKGMLPPKLARIMVNLGLAGLNQEKPVLYDPFCGSGTVLLEGLLRGCEVIGSDIDNEAVAGSLKNLYWFEKEYDLAGSFQVFASDVAHVNKHDWQVKPNLIVTEPFLGKPNPKQNELKNIFTGLRSIYLGAFKTWQSILEDNSRVVVIFPQVVEKNKTYNLLELIDKLKDYGYTLEIEPINYGYDSARVKRQILIFKYNQ